MFTFPRACISFAFTRHRKKKRMMYLVSAVKFPNRSGKQLPFSLSIQSNHMAHSKHPSPQSITPLAFI
ncbi:Uncharacterized protein BM_BM1635 [Brugia malayi]|uniref:Bm1635 n=1 Tax=Brugia malayi TaxID=6279 RepID=A0A0K0J2B9_BRUMA|nr:Uncharacterized protein BM_BM1635 [Brugia malayi]CDQ02377.1 Bm1635 [Brugia malayi]VIO96424.1 Uncharacterized protein BM_BM1635 [Brugia malayi]